MSDLMKRFIPARANELKFVAEQEPWSIYRLEDGSTVRVRLNLVKAVWTGGYLENGLPQINFQFAQVLDWEPSDEMKAEAEARKGNGE